MESRRDSGRRGSRDPNDAPAGRNQRVHGHGAGRARPASGRRDVDARSDRSRRRSDRFPDQIAKEGLQPWRVLKLYGRRFGQTSSGPRAEFDVGVYDPTLGRHTPNSPQTDAAATARRTSE